MQTAHLGRTLLVAALIGLWTAAPVWAQDPIHKAGRGITNVLTGWLEIPKLIHRGSQTRNPVVAIPTGAAKGVGLAVLRGGVGLYEVLTFPIPYPKNFVSPYEQMELPDYAWE